MKISINKFRAEFKTLIDAMEMVNDFYWKDLLRAQSESICKYPLVTAHYATAGIRINQDQIQLEINVCDKIYSDWNENLNDVESDTLNIQRQIFNAMQSPRWKQLGRIESASVRKFIADSKDYVAGHTMTLTFLLRDLNGTCDLPIFDYDFGIVGSGGGNSVTVFNSDGSYSVIVDCGGELSLPDITYSVVNSASDVILNDTVPSVNNISATLPDTTYNIFVNGVLNQSFSIPTLANEIININP